MKTNLKYYLMVAALVMAVSVSAQALPLLDMESTSSMMSSGSTLPSAAVSGVQMATMPGADGQPAKTAARGPRREWGDSGDGWGDDGWGDRGEEPYKDPVGAMPWMLMLLLCGGYAAAAAYRRRSTSLD